MESFEDFKMKKGLLSGLQDMGIEVPTPIQSKSFSPIKSGKDFLGIAQTGTGKTLAYLLPLLEELKYSEQLPPRVLILVPTRELVLQVVSEIEKLCSYLSVRVVGVYGGSNNIKRQKKALEEGADIVVGTPRRMYDLVLAQSLSLKSAKKLVIDEADLMLDFGYKTQMQHLFDLLPQKRQNILFSATMTDQVAELVDQILLNPVKESIAPSGAPLITINQTSFSVFNFYTKVNLLKHILLDKETHKRVIVFLRSKENVDRLEEVFGASGEVSIIHAGKEQNARLRAIEQFSSGESRVLIATDVIARGVDIDDVSTVISFDTPHYPENYIHRIGRTGRAGKLGQSILFFTEKEEPLKIVIEELMGCVIPVEEFPNEVEINPKKIPEEKNRVVLDEEPVHNHKKAPEAGPAFHEKLAKNSKEKPALKKYHRELKAKYKKSQKRGDKIQNMKKKGRK
ncbi:DEAD/DEAH box helicase [Luteibaculum oceani]|uniref:DEAD/DEAH box helicase n=1 Tax=Luteibaculum oceani TaxID=1294296 RepID=A0A5C6V8K8_9FLAO|nr:DEAD/DEAH box helicase [Luteibaculum oceani]TXC81722.1 DEAD/DEAH box helicase [Luteibaculum oceani]